RWSRRCGHR
ncbi:catalase-peroxidase domain protein, partial [Vibrio parahaemolyticus VPTS-2010]